MPIEVEIEGVGTAEFPDDTPKDVIQKAVRRKLAETQQHKASFGRLREAENRPEPPKKGFFDRLRESASELGDISGGIGGGVMTPMEADSDYYDAKAANLALNRGDLSANKAIVGTGVGLAAPELLVGLAPELAVGAATTRLGLAARLGAQGAAGAGAQSGVENAIDVAEGSKTVPEAVKSTALNTAGGAVAGPVIGIPAMKAAGALSGAVEAGAGNRLRGAFAGFSNPLVQDAEQKAREGARAFIEAQSGKRPLTSLGQELNERKFLGAGNAAAIEEEIARKGGKAVSPTPEERSARIEDIFKSAANLKNRGLSSDDIANRLKEALKSEVGEVTGPAEKAVDDFAATLKGAQETTRKAVAVEAEAAGGATKATTEGDFGQRARALAEENLLARKAEWSKPFDEARKLPEYKTTEVPLTNYKRWLAEQSEQGFKNEAGEVIPSTVLPAETKTILSKDAEAATGSIEVVRRRIQNLSDSIRDTDVLPGLGTRKKIEAIQALKSDLNEAIDKLPSSTLKEKLKEGNRLFSENVDAFNNAYVKGVLKDAGEGGVTGESMVKNFAGTKEKFDAFKRVLGPKANEGVDELRNAVLTKAREGAMEEGNLNIGKLVDGLSGVSPDVRAELLPGYSKLQSLAEREAKLAGFKDPKKALELFQADPKAFEGVLEGTATPKAVAAASDVLATEAAKQKKLSNSILNEAYKGNFDLINKSPANFMKRVLGGEFSTEREIPYLFSQISKHDPALVGDLQTEFLSDLLQSSKSGGIIDGRKVSKAIASPSAGTAGSSGGDKYSLAVEILGKPKVEQMQGIAKALEKTDEASFIRQLADEETALSTGAFVAGKALGGVFPQRTIANTIGSIIPTARLKVAGAILNDNALRQLAAKPMSELTKEQAATLSNAAQRYAQQYANEKGR